MTTATIPAPPPPIMPQPRRRYSAAAVTLPSISMLDVTAEAYRGAVSADDRLADAGRVAWSHFEGLRLLADCGTPALLAAAERAVGWDRRYTRVAEVGL